MEAQTNPDLIKLKPREVKNNLDKAHVAQIKATTTIGKIEPVVVDQHNRVISGNHRLAADPSWPKTVIQVKDDEDYLLKKQACKVQRIVRENERRADLMELAKLLETKGISKERISTEIAKRVTWVSKRRILQLLPHEYKTKVFVEAGKKGAETVSASVLKAKAGDLRMGEGEARGLEKRLGFLQGRRDGSDPKTPEEGNGQGQVRSKPVSPEPPTSPAPTSSEVPPPSSNPESEFRNGNSDRITRQFRDSACKDRPPITSVEDLLKELIWARDEEIVSWKNLFHSTPFGREITYAAMTTIDRGKPIEDVLKAQHGEVWVRESPRPSEHTAPPPQNKAEQILLAELSRRKINYKSRVPILRENEFTRDGKPKGFIADVVIDDCLVVEVDGEGTSSDSEERDSHLAKKGYTITCISNDLVMKNVAEVVDAIQARMNFWTCEKVAKSPSGIEFRVQISLTKPFTFQPSQLEVFLMPDPKKNGFYPRGMKEVWDRRARSWGITH